MYDDLTEDDSLLVKPSISEHSSSAEDGELLTEQSNSELSDPAEDGELPVELSPSEDSGEQTTTTENVSGSSSDYNRDTHDVETYDASQSEELELSDEDEIRIPPAPTDIDQSTCEAGDLHASNMLGTELSDHDTSHGSDSNQSVEELPTVRIRGPFLNIATKEHLAENVSGPSPQTILRGLIRDAHREMMYFTLPHSQFSLHDLRQGLDYAYSMLQVATTKLAILTVLHDDMTDMSATDLRRWMSHIEYLEPQTRYKPRMIIIFESLSAGENKMALAELVQSRLIVEDEAKQIRSVLCQRVTTKEQEVKAAKFVMDSAVDCGKGAESSSALWQFFDVDETWWDALFTAIVVVLIGALYRCVRE